MTLKLYIFCSVDSLRCLMGLEKFEDLRLCDTIHNLTNPMCMNNSYRTDVLNVLPKLRVLDGRYLSKGTNVIFIIIETCEIFYYEKFNLLL